MGLTFVEELDQARDAADQAHGLVIISISSRALTVHLLEAHEARPGGGIRCLHNKTGSAQPLLHQLSPVPPSFISAFPAYCRRLVAIPESEEPLTVALLHLRVVEHLRRDPDQLEDRHDQRAKRDRPERKGCRADKGAKGRALGQARVPLARAIVVPSWEVSDRWTLVDAFLGYAKGGERQRDVPPKIPPASVVRMTLPTTWLIQMKAKVA